MADFHPEVTKGTSLALTFIFFIGKCSCKMVLRSFFSSHNNETSRQWNISSACQGAMLRVSFSLPVLRFLKWGKVITLLWWCLILSVRRKLIKCGGAVEEKKESILLLLTFKALKWNVFTITAYKPVIFMHQFCQSAFNRYQLISIYLSIVIWKSIPTDNHRNLGHRLSISIGIDWYWLSLINDFIDWIPPVLLSCVNSLRLTYFNWLVLFL